MGRDLKGFNPDSAFRADGKDQAGTRQLCGTATTPDLEYRKGPYFEPDKLPIHKLSDIYGTGRTGSFDGNLPVICDFFKRKQKTGITVGMPILYYKADPAGVLHPEDNQALLALGAPWKRRLQHPLYTNPSLLCQRPGDHSTAGSPELYHSYELISAGPDGLYGTKDDIRAMLKAR